MTELMITSTSSASDVTNWLTTFDNGAYSSCAGTLTNFNGRMLLRLSQEELKGLVGALGVPLWKDLHPEAVAQPGKH